MSAQQLLRLLLLAAATCSCDRIRHKSRELAHQAKQHAQARTKHLADKVMPHFDAYQADTEDNKKRFRDFLQVPLTPDVQRIYCFDDAIGIDAGYQFGFACDTATVRRIVLKHGFTRDQRPSYSVRVGQEFVWWRWDKVEQLPRYYRAGDETYFQFFWYDSARQQAYYLDYDL